jgi:hypothetical protein
LHYFGKNRDGYSVNEVMLPKWAKNEHDFIRINREVLDSKQVTKGLKFWLDMIFGVRQKDESCMNIFFCYAYEVSTSSKMLQTACCHFNTTSLLQIEESSTYDV